VATSYELVAADKYDCNVNCPLVSDYLVNDVLPNLAMQRHTFVAAKLLADYNNLFRDLEKYLK